MDNRQIVEALKAHKSEITDLSAQYSALESVVVSFMLALQRHGTSAQVFEETFDFAASVHIANADANRGVAQTARSLQVVDELRKAIIP